MCGHNIWTKQIKKDNMRKFIDRVTITGADSSTDVEDLVELSKQFPFVEWGILLSKSGQGEERYPHENWLIELYNAWQENDLLLSGHICGRWVRDICGGKWTILDELPLPNLHEMFSRFQLNFRPYVGGINLPHFLRGFEDERLWMRQFVFQLDNIAHPILDVAQEAEIDAVPLYDMSGGKGELPKQGWPVALDSYCGYAGGLSPDNLQDQLQLLETIAGDGPVWIDVESKVRSTVFHREDLDLAKVAKFLQIAETACAVFPDKPSPIENLLRTRPDILCFTAG